MNEAAVVGIPDDVKGEAAFAYVILNNSDVDSDAVKAEMVQHVAKHHAPKRPIRYILFIEQIATLAFRCLFWSCVGDHLE